MPVNLACAPTQLIHAKSHLSCKWEQLNVCCSRPEAQHVPSVTFTPLPTPPERCLKSNGHIHICEIQPCHTPPINAVKPKLLHSSVLHSSYTRVIHCLAVGQGGPLLGRNAQGHAKVGTATHDRSCMERGLVGGGAQSHQGVQHVPVSDQCTHVKLVYRPHPPRNDKLVAQGGLIPVSLRRLGLPDRQHPPARSPQQGHPPCTGRSRRCQRSDCTRPRSQTRRPRASAGGTGAALHHSLHQLLQREEKHMC